MKETDVYWPDFAKSADGFLPVVVQEFASGILLMLVWTDEAGYKETLETGRGVYYSRSRKRRWAKGEESGDVQEVRSIEIDCDGDALRYYVVQHGDGACHTKAKSCFYRSVVADHPLLYPAPRATSKEALRTVKLPVHDAILLPK